MPTMFDVAKDYIRKKLADDRPGEDVRVFVQGTPWGVWMWDDSERLHIQMKTLDFVKALGQSKAIEDFVDALPAVQFQWSEVLHPHPAGG